MIHEIFFKNIDQLIEANGLNKCSFARMLGKPQSHISNWYARKTIPVNQLENIANILGVKVHELFNEDIEFRKGKMIVINKTALGSHNF
jgi:transcriptional regulator with XRE-family HTH domain